MGRLGLDGHRVRHEKRRRLRTTGETQPPSQRSTLQARPSLFVVQMYREKKHGETERENIMEKKTKRQIWRYEINRGGGDEQKTQIDGCI